MATAGGIRAGRAFVEIGADDSLLARGLRRTEARLRAFGAAIQGIGQKFVALGATAALPFVAGAKSFLDFESAMAKVRAVTQASDEDFKRLSDKAEELGRVTEFSATAAANAFSNFAESGLSIEEMLIAIRPALDLASTGSIEVAAAADIAAKAMRGMGLQATQLTDLVDVLAKSFITGGGPIEGIGEALKFVGPVARTAGISFKEIIAAIRLLSRAGIAGELAGTTLRGALLSLSNPSKEAAQELSRLGISVKDDKGNLRSLTDIITQLDKALAGAGSADKLSSLGKIFPARAAAGIASLVEQGGGALGAATQELAQSGGTASRVAAVRLNTLKGAVTILTSSIDLLASSIGAALNPQLRSLFDILTGTVNGLAKLVKENQGFVVSLAKGVATVIAVGSALFALGGIVKVVATTLGILGAAVRAVNVAVGVLTATVNLGTALTALISPAGLLTAALIGLGIWLAKTGNAGSVLAPLGDAFRSLKDDAVASFAGITNALKAGDVELAGQIFWQTLKVEWLKGTQFLRQVWANFGTQFMDTWDTATSGLAVTMTNVWATIQKGFIVATESLGLIWGKFIDDLKKSVIEWAGFFLHYLERTNVFAKDNSDKIKKIYEDEAKAKEKIDQEASQRISGAKAKIQGVETARQEAVTGITQEQNIRAENRHKAANEGVASGAAELQQAQDSLSKLLKQQPGGLAPEGVGAIAEATAGAAEAAAAQPAKISPQGLDQSIERITGKVTTAGTFNAAAIAGLGAGNTVTDAVKETTKEQKKTNEKMDKLIGNTKPGALVFGV